MMRQKTIDEIKDYLFGYLDDSSDRISELIINHRFDVVIDDVVENCYDTAVSLGGMPGAGVLATGLLHYLLTRALIPSQRKIEYKHGDDMGSNHAISDKGNNDAGDNSDPAISLDIVIPDLKTLKKDPKKSLLLCIPDTTDTMEIAQLTAMLEKIQPESQNIWLVLPDDSIATKHRTYVIDKSDNTFSKIIFDISQFTRVNQQNQFKILRI